MPAIPVLVSIRSNAHRDEQVEDETMTLITSGQLELTDEGALLRYEETIDESLPPQKVEVEIADNSLSMTRGGEYATQMVFRMGGRYEGMYRTPYGDMELAVFCTRLDYDLGEDGGMIRLAYQLDLNGAFAAVHDMELTLYRQGGEHDA